MKTNVSVHEKYLLTVEEASLYFHIGVKKLRRMMEETNDFTIQNGNRKLIKRKNLEKLIDSIDQI